MGQVNERVRVVLELKDEPAELAWQLYHKAFMALNERAVQRHLMGRHEFEWHLRDRRIRKYLCDGSDGVLAGISSYTNDLDAVPLVSPQYFARRWPRHFADQRIWYCCFLATRTGAGTFPLLALIRAMYEVAAAEKALIVIDTCRDRERLTDVVRQLLVRHAGPDLRVERMDVQSYWMFTLPGVTS